MEAGGLPGQDTNIAEAIAEYEARLPGDYHDVETNYCEIDKHAQLFTINKAFEYLLNFYNATLYPKCW